MDIVSASSDYLTTLPLDQKAALERVCQIVRQLVPSSTEVVKYSMPTFMYRGQAFLGFLAFKNHMSLYPYGSAGVDAVAKELKGFETSKGTIRFTLDHQIPSYILEKLIKFRISAIDTGGR